MCVAGAVACNCFKSGTTDKSAIEAVQTNLEFLAQRVQYAVLERFHRPHLPRRAFVRNGHAARIVHQHGDDVLLRLQFGDADRRLPQQQEQHRHQRALQQPDDRGAPGAHVRRCLGRRE